MRTKLAGLVLFFVALCILLFFACNSHDEPPVQEGVQHHGAATRHSVERTELGGQAYTGDPYAQTNRVVRTPQATSLDPFSDWKQPINFFGKVIDQDNHPVPEASIEFAWNDLSDEGRSIVRTQSDYNGCFSLENRRGKRLMVVVLKKGYYTSRQTPVAFEYATADELFIPDSHNPVVFHLRKKGDGVDLLTSAYGVKPDLQVSIPRTGALVKVDLLNRNSGSGGQMIISQSKPEYAAWKQANSWSFRMEIPDGGFVEQNDEFPFEAPESGYQPAVSFEFDKASPDWATQIKAKYYVKLGTPPRYGRLQVQTGISYGGATLTYAINPDGSRNLEPK